MSSPPEGGRTANGALSSDNFRFRSGGIDVTRRRWRDENDSGTFSNSCFRHNRMAILAGMVDDELVMRWIFTLVVILILLALVSFYVADMSVGSGSRGSR